MQNLPDLSGIRFILITTNIREIELHAALMSIIANSRNADIRLIMHGDGYFKRVTLDTASALAAAHGTLFSVARADSSRSVASIYADEIVEAQRARNITHVVSVDDDHLFTTDALRWYSYVMPISKGIVFTPSVFDISNVHNYADWCAQIRPVDEIYTHARAHGLASVAHQNWENKGIPHVAETRYPSNAGLYPLDVFDDEILEVLGNWKKGIRGKDLAIRDHLVSKGVRYFLMIGANVAHTGCTQEVFDAHWTGYSEAFLRHYRISGEEIRLTALLISPDGTILRAALQSIIRFDHEETTQL